MYKISDDQIDFILRDITNRGVVLEDIKMNILDHVCCIIENEMKPNQEFKNIYQATIKQFYKSELKEIEDETHNLLTFKNYYIMKRTLKITGFTTIFLIMLGVTFKAMHWPGAGILIVLSLISFSLIFIPLNILLKFKDDEEIGNRVIMILGLLTAAACTIGVLFKLMHWPYANIITFSSLLVFMLIFIPVYFIIKYRKPESRFNAIIHTTFMVGAAGMLFALINLGYDKNNPPQTSKKLSIENQNTLSRESPIKLITEK
ncbi:hypothetical protein DNU06_13250 [Putridiphycobacter roseus]|uniref:Gliding motility protein GldL-like N-terminal domain-containing protein n=1 Tax=Putridiphycobacter roseus TaxID=2219161 RepID=A0A2W1MXE0_9FLAO|nr:hypothetical protein [Putridiphycobacter roseus]PZE16507.1 hypothetical protein DNU06_13250 [Putridiphycobacter roseus]